MCRRPPVSSPIVDGAAAGLRRAGGWPFCCCATRGAHMRRVAAASPCGGDAHTAWLGRPVPSARGSAPSRARRVARTALPVRRGRLPISPSRRPFAAASLAGLKGSAGPTIRQRELLPSSSSQSAPGEHEKNSPASRGNTSTGFPAPLTSFEPRERWRCGHVVGARRRSVHQGGSCCPECSTDGGSGEVGANHRVGCSST